MGAGRLLAIDTPQALKQQLVTGAVYEVYAAPLMAGLSALESSRSVQRAGLAGDHLRVIVPRDAGPDALQATLEQAGVTVQSILAGEPNLEDVFIHLAKGTPGY